jgi:hypothetical protein
MDFRNTFVACSTDLGRVWHGANDSGRDSGGTHNSDSGLYDAYNSGHILRGANDMNCATRGPDIMTPVASRTESMTSAVPHVAPTS